MSLGKRDMSNESLYQDRKDVAPIRFATPPPSHHHHGGLGEQQQLECFSDEVDSLGSAELKEPASAGTLAVVSCGGYGASIEASKKRRGRPPGSKNKPKPPVVITREADPAAAMRPHVIEISCGRDVADALGRFATCRNIGICVLAGTGAVANVSLRHPTPGIPGAAPAAIIFTGQYEILSISATFLPPTMSAVAPQASAAAAGVSIALAGPHGQIIGGAVVGPLYAATTVVVIAAAFTNPTFHRLPTDDDAPVSFSVSLSAGSGDTSHDHRGHQQQDHQPAEPPQEQRHVMRRQSAPHLAAAPASAAQPSAAQPVEPSNPMPIYACHQPQPQEVMWPPAARAPHRPPPPY